LPETVVPKVYHLHLTPNFDTFKFAGKVVIDVEVQSESSEIVMNAAELEIKSAKIGSQTAEIKLDAEAEKLTLTFAEAIPVGKCAIEIEFVGIHNDNMKGFYRTKSKNQEGVEEYSFVTQFESTDARRALPCWDEPKCKAKFNVKLTVPEKKTALSNMDICGAEKHGDGTVTYTYSESPIMSTYLLAFCVGEYDYLEDKTKSGIIVRVYTSKGESAQGKFAVEVAVKSLEFYEDYFNIPYPLPKCDMIAVPDFAAGAMENWGLITYRSVCILFDMEKSSVSTKERVGIVIAHELAHQWFGNLVTMEWWTHLWLNEGFATFMEYLCIDAIYPEWEIFDEFIGSAFYNAINLDAMDSSHAIEIPVGHPSEIDEIFDAISYCKGASVIRMLYHWIGDSNFRKGMHNYLKKFSYNNALTEDLWAELGAASGLPVGEVMSGWTSQMGFPLVSADVVSWDENQLKVKLSQQKFSAKGKTGKSAAWKIPISYSSSNEKQTKQILMETNETEITIAGLSKDGWFKVNSGCVGFYQVKYQDELFTALKNNIANLSPRDRIQVEADLYACCKAGLAKSVKFLELMRGYTGEMEYSVWNDLIGGVGKFQKLAEALDCKAKMNQIVCEVLGPTATAIGFDKQPSDKHATGNLRSLIWGKLGAVGHEEMVAYSKEKFAMMVADPNVSGISADMKGNILTTAASVADSIDDFVKLHGAFAMEEEKRRVERAIGMVRKQELIEKAIDFAFSDAIRKQDMPFALIYIASGSIAGRNAVWSTFVTKFDYFKNEFKSSFMIGRLMKSVIAMFTSHEKIDEIEQFCKNNTIDSAKRAVEQGLESARLTADWLKRDGEEIKAYLS